MNTCDLPRWKFQLSKVQTKKSFLQHYYLPEYLVLVSSTLLLQIQEILSKQLLLLLGRLLATNHVSVPDALIPHQCGQLCRVSRTRVPLVSTYVALGLPRSLRPWLGSHSTRGCALSSGWRMQWPASCSLLAAIVLLT